jgi:thiol:disulfide interchange protein
LVTKNLVFRANCARRAEQEFDMKRSASHHTLWLLAGSLLFSFLLSLSCCGPDDTDAAGGSTGGGESGLVADALARGKSENKIVMVELYDKSCPTCIKMERVLKKSSVKKALESLVYARITPDDEGYYDLAKKHELTQVPSMVVYESNGKVMEPLLDGYRSSRRLVAEIENYNLIAQGKPGKELPKDNPRDFGKG